jgi:hypothetical protein
MYSVHTLNWERQMKLRRQGKSWIEPPSKQEKLNNILSVKLRPLGNSLSSLQYVQPFMIFAIYRIRYRFGV